MTAEFARGEATEESLLKAALPRRKSQKAIRMKRLGAMEHVAKFQSLLALALLL